MAQVGFWNDKTNVTWHCELTTTNDQWWQKQHIHCTVLIQVKEEFQKQFPQPDNQRINIYQSMGLLLTGNSTFKGLVTVTV